MTPWCMSPSTWGAYGCGYKALEHLGETGKSLFWGNLNAVSELRLPVPASSRACPFPQVLQWVLKLARHLWSEPAKGRYSKQSRPLMQGAGLYAYC